MKIQVLSFVAALSLLSAKETGCRRSPDLGETRPAKDVRSPNFLQKKLRNHEDPNLNFVNAQAKVFIEGNGQSIGATANIIWIRDSIMWLNIKKFGLEAARALVTRDSVFVLNRLEKTYSAQGLESLQRQYSLPAGFDLVQSLLLASPWFFPDIILESDIKDGLHRLTGSNGRFSTDYRMEEQAYWLRQEIFLQPRDARTMSVLFENYKKTELAGWFPYLRTVEAFSPESGNLRLSIELNDVEFNIPKSFRFEIPKHYKLEE
ncbi:MAG: DUF4292 domain-containing protein [Saprospiraceae bacterium]|nr:DUF4292 domain-containing protein [Saprospiraceae bacterium]